MTREDHLEWCKRRALEYLPGDPGQAFDSMASDLRKHPETADHGGIMLGFKLRFSGFMKSADEVRRFIQGFH